MTITEVLEPVLRDWGMNYFQAFCLFFVLPLACVIAIAAGKNLREGRE